MSNMVCNDTVDWKKLRIDISKMTDEELKEFDKKVKAKGKYPDKYYL